LDETSFIEYLDVKKAIDDRSLNSSVWHALVATMPKATRDHPWQVLELGAGIGSMIQRLIEWDFLHFACYIALDASPTFLSEASNRLGHWATHNGLGVQADKSGLSISDASHEIQIQFVAQEAQQWLSAKERFEQFDLVIAHAFLDLVHLETTLPLILKGLRNEGLFYFTLNFDGLTVFEPPLEESLDEQIICLYHRTMEERLAGNQPSAGAYSGRRLMRVLHQAGGDLLRAGASDWVIHAVQGKYPSGEDRFLRFLLQMVEESLSERSEIEATKFRYWLEQRHRQIDQGQLSLIVHQLDLLGRRISG
jgi:SAM-dependent methyltransferase